MSILDIFRKIFSQQEPEKQKESLAFEQLRDKINLEHKKNLDKQSETRKLVESRLVQLYNDLDNQIAVLKNLNLDKRKEEEKVKLLVRENLKLYINYLEKLSHDLKNIKEEELASYLSKVEAIFNNFHKISHPAFEKSTLLIGDELAGVRELVNSSLKDAKSLASGKEVFSDYNIISRIKSAFLELDKISLIEKEIENELANLEKSKQETAETLASANKKINDLKASPAYTQTLDAKEKRKHELEQLDNEIFSLKDIIDLKTLAKKYHADEKKEKIIADYIDNFKSALLEDKALELNDLIKQDLYKQLGLLQAKLSMKEDVFEIDRKILDLEENISNINLQVISINNNIAENNKKKEKIKENKEEIISNIKEKALLLSLQVS